MVADDEKQSIEHILELEKENKSLKEELFNIKRNTKYNWLQDTLVFDDSITAIEQWARAYEAELHNRYVEQLEEENKKLKEELKQLEERYDRNAELYKRLLEENKKLKAELDKYKNDIIYEEWLYD